MDPDDPAILFTLKEGREVYIEAMRFSTVSCSYESSPEVQQQVLTIPTTACSANERLVHGVILSVDTESGTVERDGSGPYCYFKSHEFGIFR